MERSMGGAATPNLKRVAPWAERQIEEKIEALRDTVRVLGRTIVDLREQLHRRATVVMPHEHCEGGRILVDQDRATIKRLYGSNFPLDYDPSRNLD